MPRTSRRPGDVKPPYLPTRACPHRWCPRLHAFQTFAGSAVVLWGFVHGWQVVLISLLLAPIGYCIVRAVHGGKTLAVIRAEDESPAGRKVVVERPGWLWLAVTLDMFFAILIAGMVGLMPFQALPSPVQHGALSLSIGPLALCVGLVALLALAHRLATKSRRPRRAAAAAPAPSGM